MVDEAKRETLKSQIQELIDQYDSINLRDLKEMTCCAHLIRAQDQMIMCRSVDRALEVACDLLDGLDPKGFSKIFYDPTDNQSAKADNGKPRLTLVPRRILFDIARIREYGNRKYHDPDNWKTVAPERYRDAMFRHMCAYLDDPEGVDEESGLPHLWHLACNVAFLCEMEDRKNSTAHNEKE